jgi:hypothetical protein
MCCRDGDWGKPLHGLCGQPTGAKLTGIWGIFMGVEKKSSLRIPTFVPF